MTPEVLYGAGDYRGVLRAWLEAPGHPRSHAELARRVGASRSMVSMVLSGARDIPLARAGAWAEALELDGGEVAYFEALVRAEVGETLGLRRAARTFAAATREFQRATRLGGDGARLLERWYVPVLLELARVGELAEDAAATAARLWPAVDPSEVAATVAELVAKGVLRA